MVELIPVINNNINKMAYEGARPRRLMDIAEIAGVNITRYFTQILSASNPIKGLKSEGIFLMTSNRPAMDNDNPCLLMSKGSIGARNAV